MLIWISYRKHDHIMCASLSSQYSHVISIASLENYSSRPSSLWASPSRLTALAVSVVRPLALQLALAGRRYQKEARQKKVMLVAA